MRYQLTIPARINILGNPSDANEGDFSTISAAVDLRAGALIEPAEGITLEIIDFPGSHVHTVPDDLSADDLSLRLASGETQSTRQQYTPGNFPVPEKDQLRLLKGSLNRLYKYSEEFAEKVQHQGFRLVVSSDVPPQSGLGGSSLFVLLCLAAMRLYYELDKYLHNDYILGELAQQVESLELGITCGFADRYVPLFGGIAYLDYRGKLYHHPLRQDPFVTYERLDSWVDQLPIVAISSGVKRDSGDVHSRMRPRYLEEHNSWMSRGGDIPQMVAWMQGCWQTAWRGKIALLEKDWETFGAMMNKNHHLVNEMMIYCGFRDGVGWANKLFIDSALKNGALGAKLTGAGGGGSVFALTLPGEEQKLSAAWTRIAEDAGLREARIFLPKISPQGLIIQQV